MTNHLLDHLPPLQLTSHEAFACPTCGGRADVLWRDVFDSTDGPVEHVKIQCANRHWYLMPSEDLDRHTAEVPAPRLPGRPSHLAGH